MKQLKKKINLIIGKKQIIIVALLFTLSLAAFLNWQFASTDQAVTVMDVSEKSKNKQKQNNSKQKGQTYGEAELVSKTEDKKLNNNYIKQAKLDRDSAFDESIENNNKILNSTNLEQEEKSKILDQTLELTERKNQQESIEGQIKNKNFVDDCIAYVEDSRVNVFVKTKNLTQEQATQIKDIACSVTNFSASNVTITPVSS